ncbi:MAG: hypothetical protein NDI80_09885, partial [Flavobacteriaceae bacterium]|nr:hypothetical protein [Flavobacteriaceae bacterium]
MKFIFNKIYQYSPLFLKEIIISVYGIYWKNRRYGGVFKKELQLAKERESYSVIQWEKYQTKQLRKILIHAYQTVPYYREKYSALGFTVGDFQKFELNQIMLLPVLEKDDLRKYGTSELLSTRKEKGFFLSSSGSTGTPVKIYFSKKTHQRWNALYETRVRNWAGVNYQHSRGMIGGRRIVPTSSVKCVPYIRNHAENQTYFSAYHISSETFSNYLEGMFKYPIDYLVGYAISIYLLAKLFEEHKCEVPRMKAVLTSSEKLTPKMRTCIEHVFQCKVY